MAKNADAVLNRMGQMAGLNIGRFIRINAQGLPYYDFTDITEEDFLGLSGLDIKQESVIAAKNVETVEVPVISIKVKTDITKNLHALARHHGLLKETVVLEDPTEVDDIEVAKRIAFLLDKARRDRKKQNHTPVDAADSKTPKTI